MDGSHVPADAVTTAGQTNAKAVAALVLGIAGLVLVPLLASIVAIVVGRMAREEIASSGEEGSELATVGIVLGWVGIAVGILGIVLFMLVFGVAFWLNGS